MDEGEKGVCCLSLRAVKTSNSMVPCDHCFLYASLGQTLP